MKKYKLNAKETMQDQTTAGAGSQLTETKARLTQQSRDSVWHRTENKMGI